MKNPNYKTCKKCGRSFPETTDFYVKQSNQSGKTWWSKKCRECMYPKSVKFKSKKKTSNDLSGEMKAVDLYTELSKKIHILMRKNRITKYTTTTQNIIINLMELCYKHLNNELNLKEVIIIDCE